MNRKNLKEAVKRKENDDIDIIMAACYYGILSRTLQRCKALGKLTKNLFVSIGSENKKRLVLYIEFRKIRLFT